MILKKKCKQDNIYNHITSKKVIEKLMDRKTPYSYVNFVTFFDGHLSEFVIWHTMSDFLIILDRHDKGGSFESRV